ncbi:MAG: ParB/RepB/Spo0J family partition protein [Hyphomicrobiaceae bacterium]|nr:ParB/RepB/Spo0J family partition protein [Hyphomicrobiaceae bacterium]
MSSAPMPIQRSRLGRGLASLIGETSPQAPRLPPEGEQKVVAIDMIRSSAFNPRKDFREDDLAELAESIRQKGLVQPIVVRIDPSGTGGYEIVAGERRWRAAQRAGLHTVPVIVRELGDQEMLEFAIIENVQRADLNAIEEATGYSELMERFAYTQERLAEVIGKSRSHVANTLRLLKLPDTVRTLVREGKLTAGHARALVGRDDAEALAQRVVERDMNVRAVEALVHDLEHPPEQRGKRDKDADTRAFEKELADSLGLKVEIKRGSGESGVLQIKYSNFDQLEYLRLRLIGAQGGS